MARKPDRRNEATAVEEGPVETLEPQVEDGVVEDESPSCDQPRRRHHPAPEIEESHLEATEETHRLPSGGSAKFVLRAACYIAGRFADQLVSTYTRAVSLDRDYIADFNKSAGLAHARHRRWDKAIPLLEKALHVDPDDVETRMRIAEAFAANHQYEKACEHLERILVTTPNSAAALRILGAIFTRQQNYDRAVEYLEKAVKVDPDHAQTHYRLGIAYDNRKQYDQAVDAFKAAIRLDPRLSKAYQSLGFTYETMGNRELAVECFKKALELE